MEPPGSGNLLQRTALLPVTGCGEGLVDGDVHCRDRTIIGTKEGHQFALGINDCHGNAPRVIGPTGHHGSIDLLDVGVGQLKYLSHGSLPGRLPKSINC